MAAPGVVSREHINLSGRDHLVAGGELAAKALMTGSCTIADIATAVIRTDTAVVTGRIVAASDSRITTRIHQPVSTGEELRFTDVDTIVSVAVHQGRPGKRQSCVYGEKEVGHVHGTVTVLVDFTDAMGDARGC